MTLTAMTSITTIAYKDDSLTTITLYLKEKREQTTSNDVTPITIKTRKTATPTLEIARLGSKT
ncbi:17319_t:CDS:2, partial [Gigaspora rosea]